MITTRRKMSVGNMNSNAKRSHCLFASRMPWLASLLAAHHTELTDESTACGQQVDQKKARSQRGSKTKLGKLNVQGDRGSQCWHVPHHTRYQYAQFKDTRSSSKIVYIVIRIIFDLGLMWSHQNPV